MTLGADAQARGRLTAGRDQRPVAPSPAAPRDDSGLAGPAGASGGSDGLGAARPSLNAREHLLLSVLQRHVGPDNAIPQLELAEAVGYRAGGPDAKRRQVQLLLDSVREKRGVPIFTSCRKPMGVFVASCPEDAAEYLARMTNRVAAELETIKQQKAILAAAFEGPQPRLFPSDPPGSASELSGAGNGNSEAARNGSPRRRPCACGCGIWFRVDVYNRRYVSEDHRKDHEASFYRIGKAVVEAGLEEVFVP